MSFSTSYKLSSSSQGVQEGGKSLKILHLQFEKANVDRLVFKFLKGDREN